MITKIKLFDYIILFTLASVLILWTLKNGEIIGCDSVAHAMTGIFFSDFIRDLAFLKGIHNIYNYIWNYYVHYPELGLIHWPPLFHIIEGLFLLLTGINEINLRVLIYLFFIIGLFYYYRLMVYLFNTRVAFLASVMLICSPMVLINARMVTLEIPSLVLCIIATYYYYNYIISHRFRCGIVASIFISLSLLVKQTSIYLVVFIFIHYVYLKLTKSDDKSIINYRHIATFISIIIILTAPYYIIAMCYHGATISKDLFQGSEIHHPYTTMINYIYYIVTLPEQINIITIYMLLIFILLLLFLNKKSFSQSSIFLILWMFSCYIVFTMIAQKQVRYIIYWIPALCGLASMASLQLVNHIGIKSDRNKINIMIGVIILLSLAEIYYAIKFPQPFVTGYDNVAEYISSITPQSKGEIILYDGKDHGVFCFSLRKSDVKRRMYLFRCSKYFYTDMEYQGKVQGIINTKEEMIRFLQKYGIRYIILSSLVNYTIPQVNMIRDIIKDEDNFILLKKFFIVNTLDGGCLLSLYLYKGAKPIYGNVELDILMPKLKGATKIKVNLNINDKK